MRRFISQYSAHDAEKHLAIAEIIFDNIRIKCGDKA